MSVPNQAVRPTPQNLTPPDTVCLQIEVPNDREWIAAYLDAVEQLSYWFSWDRDEARTGRGIAARWWRAFLSIRKCKPEALIRQNPDDPCLLESSTDGIHWCTLFDISLCTPQPGQPGSGARQPLPGGGEECYHSDSPANMQWNLPTVVNAGDTIEVRNTQGQATDAPNHVWYCPNGQLFLAGKCVSVPFTQGGDPAASADHMTIVCQIAGVWYATAGGPITVPGGVANAPVVFQVNDGVLSDNSGGYAYDVCVTNNGSVGWCKLWNYALSPYAFVIEPNPPAADPVWTAGSGFLATGVDSNHRTANIGLAIASTHITYGRLVVHFAAATGGFSVARVMFNGVTAHEIAPTPAGDVVVEFAGDYPAVVLVEIQSNSAGSPSCEVIIKSLELRGDGTPPTDGDPCSGM
jgi:hypothetical protein